VFGFTTMAYIFQQSLSTLFRMKMKKLPFAKVSCSICNGEHEAWMKNRNKYKNPFPPRHFPRTHVVLGSLFCCADIQYFIAHRNLVQLYAYLITNGNTHKQVKKKKTHNVI
jgi:hypothetical protein